MQSLSSSFVRARNLVMRMSWIGGMNRISEKRKRKKNF